MKNIQIVKIKEIENFLSEKIWSTSIFKQLQQKKGSLLNMLIEKLKVAPIFFYEINHPSEKKHLTSFFRFIAHRTYDNPYIQDLYYFHELVHAATFDFKKNNHLQWQEELNENELLASLYSEVFIYLVEPELLDKTFEDLWVSKFLDENKNKIQPCNLSLDLNNGNDRQWLDNYYLKKINFFNLDLKNWPHQIQQVIMQRRYLRTILDVSGIDLSSSELKIVSYNKKMRNWLPKWENYYLQINHHLQDFFKISQIDELKAINSLLDFIHKYSNDDGIAFFSVLGLDKQNKMDYHEKNN